MENTADEKNCVEEQRTGSELVGHTVQKRNWKGIVIALVVIIAVCALIVTTIILLQPKEEDGASKAKFTFQDFMSRKFAPRTFSFQWITDADGMYYRNKDGAVIKYNCSTDNSTMIMNNSTFKELDTSSYTISPDETFALLPYEIKKVYRHSTRAKYRVVDLKTGASGDLQGPRGLEFQYVSWSPAYDGLVFVQQNDVYYRRSMLNISVSDAYRVTDTGIADEIFNGVPDWVFEEEILFKDNAIWWSPNGHYFLYASFNDTLIGRFDLTYYGDMTKQYVENRKLLYPKAGTTNPTFTLTLFDTRSNSTVQLSPPDDFKDIDHYFTTVTWKDNDNVLVTWLNRHQNVSIFMICKAADGTCKENYRFVSQSGWCDVYVSPIFTPDGGHYFIILPQREGDAGYYRHIAMVDAANVVNIGGGNLGQKTFVTTGLYDVISISSFIPSTNTIYYLAYKTGDPTVRHIFKTSTDSSDPEFQKPVCVTCSLSKDCEWVSASFSDVGDYYMLSCLGPGVPTYKLHSVSGETDVSFEDNKDIAEELAKIALPKTRYLRIPLDDTQSLWAKLRLPPDLNEEEVTEYNLLTSVYGGPDTQRVTKRFTLGWEDYLSSSHNLVIGEVDTRGSSGRGDRWRHANYRRLGTTEVEDTILAGRYFKGLKYVGPNTAIWGWSYGGYLTASILGKASGVFSCGISVAPVTEWRYYDTVYTERYMGLPGDNKEAYDSSNVSSMAENFKHSKFMLVHGTGDDNVHFQNAAQLVRALTEANVYFRSQFYTDQQHSINGGNSRKHLYNTLEDFLLQCYSGKSTRIDELNEEPDSKDDQD